MKPTASTQKRFSGYIHVFQPDVVSHDKHSRPRNANEHVRKAPVTMRGVRPSDLKTAFVEVYGRARKLLLLRENRKQTLC